MSDATEVGDTTVTITADAMPPLKKRKDLPDVVPKIIETAPHSES